MEWQTEPVCSALLARTSLMKEAQNASSALSDFLSQSLEHFENLSASIYVRFTKTFHAVLIAPAGFWPMNPGEIVAVRA